MGVAPTILKNEGSKIGLKFSVLAVISYNFGARGSNHTKLFHVTCRRAGTTMWVQILEFGMNLCNFRLPPQPIGSYKDMLYVACVRNVNGGQSVALLKHCSAAVFDIPARDSTRGPATLGSVCYSDSFVDASLNVSDAGLLIHNYIYRLGLKVTPIFQLC